MLLFHLKRVRLEKGGQRAPNAMVSQWHHQSQGLGSKTVPGAGAGVAESTVLSAQARQERCG